MLTSGVTQDDDDSTKMGIGKNVFQKLYSIDTIVYIVKLFFKFQIFTIHFIYLYV